jgi:hypothetical protein
VAMYISFRRLFRFASIASCLILVACSGGGGGGGSNGGNNSNGGGVGGSTQHTLVSLAKIDSGGGFSLALANNRIYFTDSNDSEIHSVPVLGGAITTHLYYSSGNLNPLVHRNGNLFSLQPATQGGLYSIPDNVEGVASLSATQKNGNFVEQIDVRGSNVYWVESACDVISPGNCYSSKIWRAPLTPTSTTNYSQGRTTDLVVNKAFQGISKFAVDGNLLFVSESQTGNIYRVDLSTGNYTQIATGISPGALRTLSMVVTNEWLFVLTRDSSALLPSGINRITRIDKLTGSTQTIANSSSLHEEIVADAGGMYWWEWQSPATAIDLKRYDSFTGTITTLATVPVGSPSTIFNFFSDGANVWWVRDYTIPVGLGFMFLNDIQHVSTSGGAVTTIASINKSIYGSVNGLTGDATTLFWSGMGGFWKMPKAGGIWENISSGGFGASKFIVTGTHFVWGGSGLDAVWKMPMTGVTDPTLLWKPADANSSPTAITADDLNLYWTTDDYDPTTTNWSIGVYSRPIAGGSVQRLGTITSIGRATRIYQSDDTLLIVRDSASGGGISAIPKIGGPEVEFIATSPDGPTDVFIKDNILYFLYAGLYAYDIDTGNEIILNTDFFPNANRLYIDDSHIYWTEANRSSGTGAVRRIPISGGMAEAIYSGNWSWDIRGDTESIYWATGMEIISANKN